MLACFALSQQAAAQNSTNFGGSTFTISDADPVDEGGTARFTVTVQPAFPAALPRLIRYTAGSAELDDLGSGRPTSIEFNATDTSYTIEVPIHDDDTVEGEEIFTVGIIFQDTVIIQAMGTINASDGTPPPAVNISIDNASATEGGDIRFPVTLSTQLLEARTLNVGYTAGSGNTGAGLDDLGSDRPTTLTLPTGTTTVNLVVPTVDDTDDENDETFTVTLSLPDPPANPANTLNITTSTATGTINDNDDTPDAEVSITNASVAENAAAGAIGFTVSLDRAADSDVTLAVAYAAVTATLGTDLGTRPTTVTIDQGQTEATLTVPVTNDAIVEGNETFTVTLSEGTTSLPDGVSIGADNAATGTITDADTAGVSLSSTAPPPGSEGGTITFTVNLDNPVAERFTLGWTATDGTATVEDDLDDQSGTVEIPANAETATFTIPVTNDDDIEDSETFTVALTGAPTGLVNIAPSRITVDQSSATGTINASDAVGANTVTIGNRSVAENVSGGNVDFTVSLDRAVGSDVTLAVAYAAGTATLADDLKTPLPTSVTIAEGNTSGTLKVPVANETLVESNETFTVTLREDPANPLPVGVEIGNGVATGTITNDDQSEIVTTVADVNEVNASLTFRPAVTVPIAQDLVLAWEVTGGTASAADFKDYVSSGTVTIPARQGDAQIQFMPLDDDLVEGSEFLTLTFSPAPGTSLPDGVTFRRTTATATIRDSDEADINLRLVADVSETDARLTFRPELTRRLTQDITVAWEVTGGTASADDFTQYAGSGTVTIEAGRGGTPIRFFPLDDDAVEDAETLELTISVDPATPLPRGVNLGTTTTATATIADDDTPVVNATVSIDHADVAENGGNAEFTVSLTQAVDSPVTLAVAYAAGITNPATLTTDLGTRPTTVTIDQGQTEATLMVPVINDEIVEGDETFTVTISQGTTPLPDGVTIGTDNQATGTITDNDTAVVTLSPSTLETNEGDSFTYTVRLSAPADAAVNLTWTASAEAGDSATVADDLQQITNTITFAANDNTDQEFTIATTQDSEDEPNETFTVTIEATGTLPDGVEIDTDEDSSVATIVDDDGGPTTPGATVSIGNASVAENVAGGSVDFTVSLSTAVTGDVLLNVVYGGGVTNPATPDDDLGSGRPTTVTITEGETIATLTVPITNDEIVEGNETFTVTLSVNTAPDEVTISTTAGRATGAIIDDDEAEVAITSATSSAAEGATFTFGVTLSEEVDEAVTVRWTATGSGSNAATVSGPGSDLGQNQEATGTVTFLANNTTSQEVTIVTSQDTRVEADEAFTVTLSVPGGSSLPNGVMINTNNNSATATIENDDQDPSTSATVSINDATAVAEDGTAIFLVSLSRAVTDNVVLAVTYESDTATIADDLQSNPPDTVTITANRTSATLSVPINDDDIVEDNETFTVILGVADGSSLPTGVTINNARATAIGTITDNDSSTASIDPLASAEVHSLLFTVALSNPVAEDVVLTWTATVDPDDSTSPDLEAGDTASELAENGEATGTVTIIAGSRSARFRVDTTGLSAGQTVTVTLSDPNNTLPGDVNISESEGRATANVVVASELIEPRRSGALSTLRHHVSHFERITSAAVHNRLHGSGHGNGFGLSEDLDSGNVVRGTASDDHRWGAWINTSFVGFDGESTGRQADIYAGIDYLSDSGNRLTGILLGIESANLEVGEADYESEFVQLGVYGGVRLAENLIWDGAIGYGTSDPSITQDELSATHDAQRITVRNQLTGSYDLLSSGRLRLSPQLGMLYARERISDFTDSAGNMGSREVLEIGRISAGPRLTWEPRQGREVEFGVRLHWDVVNSESGREREVSGSADLGIRFPMTSKVKMGIFLEADGLGITDEFATYGGRIEIRSTY